MNNNKSFLATILLIMLSSMFLLGIFNYLGNFAPETSEREQTSPSEGSLENVTDSSPESSQDGYPESYPEMLGFGTEVPAECGRLPHIPLFNVSNAEHTSLISCAAYSLYENKKWKFLFNGNAIQYEGEEVVYDVTGYNGSISDDITITPLTNLSKFVPVSFYTTRLAFPRTVSFYREYGAFYIEESFVEEYSFRTVHYSFDEETLRNAEPVEDAEYLQLPKTVTERTRELAYSITQMYDSPYEKAKAIEFYLKHGYQYSYDREDSPEGWDPVDWFLFEERKGHCVNFASAFVVLARCVGIPARFVAGYAVKATAKTQTVYADDSHAWAQVGFKDIGWIDFNPTAPHDGEGDVSPGSGGQTSQGKMVETELSIVDVDPARLRKGELFYVEGTVTAEYGSILVDNMPVEVYLFETINGNVVRGMVCGAAKTRDGWFNIACVAPIEAEAGVYKVVAHSLGTELYGESWSDPSFPLDSVINITSVSPSRIRKGEPFYVSGMVKSDMGAPLDGLPVEIYVNKTKSYGGIICGRGETADGHFNVTCMMPEDVDVGLYQVIAHMPGNNWCHESWSDPAVTVVAATNITLLSPCRVEVKKTVPIIGRLTDAETGEPIENMPVEIYVNDFKEIMVKTDPEGYFSYNYTFIRPRTYVVKAVFAGAEYYEPSEVRINVKVDVVRVHIWTSNVLVRGKPALFHGKITFGEEPLNNTIVNVIFDSAETFLIQAETNSSGIFECLHEIPESMPLGTYMVTYQILETRSETVQEVAVKAETFLTVTSLPPQFKVRPGENFTMTVEVRDDMGNPLANALISALNLSGFTDSTGKAVFLFKTPEDVTGNEIKIPVRFEGTLQYMPSNITVSIPVVKESVPNVGVPSPPLGNWICIVLPAGMVLAAAATLLIKKRRFKNRKEVKEVGEDAAGSARASNSMLKIMFPQIEESMPPVWGVGERFNVEIHVERKALLKAEKIKAYINDRLLGEYEIKGGAAKFTHQFRDKGEYKIRCVLEGEEREYAAERSLRIVDYREEVVSIYHKFLEYLKDVGVGISSDMTPREVLWRAVGKGLLREPLEELVKQFEVAQYSTQTVERKHYVSAWKSFASIKSRGGSVIGEPQG